MTRAEPSFGTSNALVSPARPAMQFDRAHDGDHLQAVSTVSEAELSEAVKMAAEIPGIDRHTDSTRRNDATKMVELNGIEPSTS
jgi:hypothetical protein